MSLFPVIIHNIHSLWLNVSKKGLLGKKKNTKLISLKKKFAIFVHFLAIWVDLEKYWSTTGCHLEPLSIIGSYLATNLEAWFFQIVTWGVRMKSRIIVEDV